MQILLNSIGIKKALLGLTVAGLIALGLSQYLLQAFPLSVNEGIYGTVAREMHRGSLLYRDIWDHKPPLVYLHYLLIDLVCPHSDLAIHLYAMVVHWSVAALLGLLASQLFPERKLGFVVALAYAFLIFAPNTQPWTLQADLLMQPFLLSAFIFALGKDSWRNDFVSGLFWAAAFFTKQSAIFWLPLFLILWKDHRMDRFIRFFFGADLMALVVATPFILTGRFVDFKMAVTTFNIGYVEGGWNEFWTNAVFRSLVEKELFWLGVVLGPCMILATSNFFRGSSEHKRDFFISVWFLLATFECVFAGTFYHYYWIVIMPPLAMGIATGWSGLGLRYGAKALGLVTSFCLAPFLIVNVLAWRSPDGLVELAGYSLTKMEQLRSDGLSINKISHSFQERIWILARGPQIYWYSGMRPAFRTIVVDHIPGLKDEWLRIEENFHVNSPQFVVLDQKIINFSVPTEIYRIFHFKYSEKPLNNKNFILLNKV